MSVSQSAHAVVFIFVHWFLPRIKIVLFSPRSPHVRCGRKNVCGAKGRQWHTRAQRNLHQCHMTYFMLRLDFFIFAILALYGMQLPSPDPTAAAFIWRDAPTMDVCHPMAALQQRSRGDA